jgi:hypothetical protein
MVGGGYADLTTIMGFRHYPKIKQMSIRSSFYFIIGNYFKILYKARDFKQNIRV